MPATPAAAGAADLQQSIPVPQAAASAVPSAPATVSAAAMLHVSTDVLELDINLKGGELDRADLRDYPLRKDAPNIPVRLLNQDSPATLYVLQSGLTGEAGEAAPSHLATWSSSGSSFELGAGATELRVPLIWSDGHGLTVTKTFVLTRGRYAIDLIYDVRNDSTAARKLAAYSQFLRHWEHASRS